jgi:hypothetical protein
MNWCVSHNSATITSLVTFDLTILWPRSIQPRTLRIPRRLSRATEQARRCCYHVVACVVRLLVLSCVTDARSLPESALLSNFVVCCVTASFGD